MGIEKENYRENEQNRESRRRDIFEPYRNERRENLIHYEKIDSLCFSLGFESLEDLSKNIPYLNEFLNDERHIDDIIKLAKVAGEHARPLFMYRFLDMKEDFINGGMGSIKEKWMALVDLGEFVRQGSFHNEDVDRFFGSVFNKISSEFNDEKLRPSLMKLAKISKKGVSYFFGDIFPGIRYEFNNDKLRPSLIKLAEVFGDDTYEAFYDGLREFREVFHDDELRPDFIKLSILLGFDSCRVFYSQEKLRNAFINNESRPGVIKMAKVSGKYSQDLFEYGFSAISEKFEKGGYSAVKSDWLSLVKMAKVAGEYSQDLFEYGFPVISEKFEKGGYSAVKSDWLSLVKMAKVAGWNASDMFRDVFPKIREDFSNGGYGAVEKSWSEMINVSKYDRDIPYFLSKLGVFEKKILDENLKDDLVKMAKSAGYYSEDMFRYVFPEIREDFSDGGYEAVESYWLDIIKFMGFFGNRDVGHLWDKLGMFDYEFVDDFLRGELIKMVEVVGSEYSYELFKYGFPEIQEEFRLGGYKAVESYWLDLARMGEVGMVACEYSEYPNSSGYLANMFEYGFPEVKEKFRVDGYEAIEDYWKDFVKISEVAGDTNWIFLKYGFSYVKEEFKLGGYEATKSYWMDLAKMAKIAGKDANLFLIIGLPLIGERLKAGGYKSVEDYCLRLLRFIKTRTPLENSNFYDRLLKSDSAIEMLQDSKLGLDFFRILKVTDGNVDIFDKYSFHEGRDLFYNDNLRPDFIEMLEVAGKNAGVLFEYGFPEISEKFRVGGYEAIESYWIDLVKMAEIGGEDSSFLFEYGFPKIKEDLQSSGFDSIKEDWLNLKWLVKIADNDSYVLFKHCLPKIGKQPKMGKLDSIKKYWLNLKRLANIVKERKDLFFEKAFPYIEKEFNEGGVTAVKTFVEGFKRLPAGISIDRYFAAIIRFGKTLNKEFLDSFIIFDKYLLKDGVELIEIIERHYDSGSRDLKPFKYAMNVFDILGGDGVSRLVSDVDFDKVFKGYGSGSVEEKVLVMQFVSPYLNHEYKEKLKKVLNLTLKQVDSFLSFEEKSSKQKLSNYYYIIKAYGFIGNKEASVNVLKRIDLSKIMGEEMGIEIFGLLEELNVSDEVFENVINNFSLNLRNIQVVEKVRKRLLNITQEKANRIIEIKAKEYVKKPITDENLDGKVAFVEIWSNPIQNISATGLDDRFVFDIYVFAANQMKNSLKRYVSGNYVEGYEDWGIFDKKELVEIGKIQLVLKWQKRQKGDSHQLNKQEQIEKARQGRMEELRDWVLRYSTVVEVQGRILNQKDLQNRLNLFLGFEAEGLTGQMDFIREQIVSYINRTRGKAVDAVVKWKGKSLKLRDVLSNMEIEFTESADNIGARIGKLFDTDIETAYKARKIAAKVSHKGRMLKESLFGAGSAKLVSGKLSFESGFSGGGENYSGGNVELSNEHVHSSASLYTVERGGDTEAIIVKFDPKFGARFKFLVQVGATTGGNKKDLSKVLRSKYENALMMDTVGSMVQGEGMPISMIFENGEVKNKKTTMAGQRDGLVIFSPGGRMAVVKKTVIHYLEMAQVARLKAFRKDLDFKILEIESEFNSSMDSEISIDSFGEENKDAIRKYRKLLEVRELFNQWKAGKVLNYASEESYLHQELFWMIAKHSKLSGFLESLYVENSESMTDGGSAAHKRLLLKFYDGTFGIYDSRIAMSDGEVSKKITKLIIDGKKVQFAVNLDTGMADDTRIYDKKGRHFQVGHTSQPVGTNRIGVWHKEK